MTFLVSATLKPVEDNSDLSELYDRLLGQWSDEVNHVVKVVGGEWMREKSGSQPGPRYTPVSAERQRAAVAFVAANVFTTPRISSTPLLLPADRTAGCARPAPGDPSPRTGQSLERPTPQPDDQHPVALSSRPADAYTPLSLFVDVRHAIWSELSGGSVEIYLFRRNLQRVYITILAAKVAPPPAQVQMGWRPPRGGAAGTFGSDIRRDSSVASWWRWMRTLRPRWLGAATRRPGFIRRICEPGSTARRIPSARSRPGVKAARLRGRGDRMGGFGPEKILLIVLVLVLLFGAKRCRSWVHPCSERGSASSREAFLEKTMRHRMSALERAAAGKTGYRREY